MAKLYKLINLIYYLIRFGNLPMAVYLARHNFPIESINEVTVKAGKLVIKKTGQAFSREQLAPCQKSLRLFLSIATHDKVKIDNSTPGELTIICGETRIKGETFDNFYLVQEIYIDGVYNFFQKEKEIVVVDVGMNVGLASLFFAEKPAVKKVYSFEPFPLTYQRALANFELNPLIKNKIVPHNQGVDGSDATLQIPVGVGESAISSTSDFFLEKLPTDPSKTISVVVKDIKPILNDVFAKHLTERIILKLDCEGAEYEILSQMNKAGLIKRLGVIVIEWHMKGYESLRDILVENDFCTTVLPRPNVVLDDIGLIYAVNTKL